MTLSVSLFGPDWLPKKPPEHHIDEREMLTKAFTDYYVATGIIDIPPWLALCVSVGVYAMPRFTMPETRSRLRTLGVKVGLVKAVAED